MNQQDIQLVKRETGKQVVYTLLFFFVGLPLAFAIVVAPVIFK